MSGHSKWHNIRLRKESQDVRKGKLFSKVAREIIMAAKAGGGNPEGNSRLRLALQKAREVGMPNDNVKRAIQRGTGEIGGAQYEALTYEGYGPGGVALLIHASTDNRNRTVGEVRGTLTRNGGSLGESNCVAWMFEQKGVILVSREAIAEEALLELALEAGGEDMTSDADSHEIVTAPGDFEAVRAALAEKGVEPQSAEVTLIPKTKVMLEGERQAQQVLRLMEELEDLEDVQRVYANFDIPDAVMSAA
jgi:YebC/PmpR family DNA-binding regulatory protein